jgi:hypothetical protein
MKLANLSKTSILAATLLTLGAACTAEEDSGPTTEELRGIWVSVEGGVNHVMVFRMQDGSHAELIGKTNVVMVYEYPVGSSDAVVLTGTYEADAMGDSVITQVLWDEAGQLDGSELVEPVTEWDGITLGLDHGGAVRVYDRADAMP